MRDAQRLGFESKVLGKGVARTSALESLVICSFPRGLSVRDVEAALAETFDERWSRSQRSPGSGATRLSATGPGASALRGHDLVYCFLEAIYLKLRPDDEPAEGCSSRGG